MNDLIDLMEWNRFADERKTLLEALTILNNRHLKAVDKVERERDEAREQIAASAINTNVRLFDLVRYSRASLHEDELITDEEYAWLCGGAEMANSPKGGSPSPRRLEDYDALRKQLEAMREAIVVAAEALKAIAEAKDAPDIDIGGESQFGLHCGVEDRGCQSRYDGADVGWSQGVERTLEWSTNEANSALAKLQPFLKP